MRIDNAMPAFYTSLPQNTAQVNNLPRTGGEPRIFDAVPPAPATGPGIVVDISPEGWEAYARSRAVAEGSAAGTITSMDDHRCETCDSRRYQDSSDDPSVSFQTPTHISPGQSAAMVLAHENEHVANEQVKAEQDGRRIISQTVSLQSSICPECNRMYISGGETRTVTAEDNSNEAVDVLDLSQFT